MWNRKSLVGPPHCSLAVKLTMADKATLTLARKSLSEADEVINRHMPLLNNEMAVLLRLTYKLKNQFRSDKAMKGLEMVKSCLLRLDDVKVTSVVHAIQGLIDLQDNTGESVYLGSRQLLEFHLVKLQGVCALLKQTLNYLKYTFFHARRHLGIGHLIPQNMVMLALASRLWGLLKSLLVNVLNWYKLAYSCRSVLPPTQVPWLPADEDLPEELAEWLDVQFPSRLGHTGADLEEEEELFDAEDDLDIEEFALTASSAIGDEDLGEPIKRKTSNQTMLPAMPSPKRPKLESDLSGDSDNDKCDRSSTVEKDRQSFMDEITSYPDSEIFTMVKRFKTFIKLNPKMFAVSGKTLKAIRTRIDGLMQAYREKQGDAEDVTVTIVRELIKGLLSPPKRSALQREAVKQQADAPSTELLRDSSVEERPSTSAHVEDVRRHFESHLTCVADVMKLKKQAKLGGVFTVGDHSVVLSKRDVVLLKKRIRKFSGTVENKAQLPGLSRLREDLVDMFASILNDTSSQEHHSKVGGKCQGKGKQLRENKAGKRSRKVNQSSTHRKK